MRIQFKIDKEDGGPITLEHPVLPRVGDAISVTGRDGPFVVTHLHHNVGAKAKEPQALVFLRVAEGHELRAKELGPLAGNERKPAKR